jgi:response regulator NasT
VIALLEGKDAEFVNEAAKRGIFAYIADGDPEELQSSIDVVLRRFAEYHNLEGAFGRRAITERAKGILMERHGIGDREAFERIRTEARTGRRPLIEVVDELLSRHGQLARSR